MKDENVALANSKARLPSDALDTSLGTDNCGSPQLRNAAEPKSHIYNSKRGPFSEAIVIEKYCFIESDMLLHHSGNQTNTLHFQHVDIEAFEHMKRAQHCEISKSQI